MFVFFQHLEPACDRWPVFSFASFVTESQGFVDSIGLIGSFIFFWFIGVWSSVIPRLHASASLLSTMPEYHSVVMTCDGVLLNTSRIDTLT